MSPRALFMVLAGVPLAVFAGAYGWLALDHRTPWVLDTVVHESGRYTLAGTILYTRHFLRELPVAAVYAAAPAAAVAAYGPRPTTSPSARVRIAALVAAAFLVATAWLATVRSAGADVAWDELVQSYLRDEDVPIAGAHWGYHLLSTVVYVAACVVGAAGLRRALGGPSRPGRTTGLVGLVLAFVAMTLVCGTGRAPFVDARHLGHEAREAATHLVVTLPLAFAVLLAAGRWRRETHERPARWPRAAVVAAVVGGVALAHLAVGSLVAGAADTARPGVPLSSLVAAHCFEHALDDVLVIFLVVALAPRAQSREARSTR